MNPVIRKIGKPLLLSSLDNFALSFTVEAKPGAVLRCLRHELEISVVLYKLCECRNYWRMAGDGVCDCCGFHLFESVKNHVNIQPTTVRLISTIGEAQTAGDYVSMRTLVYFTANMFRTALGVYTRSAFCSHGNKVKEHRRTAHSMRCHRLPPPLNQPYFQHKLRRIIIRLHHRQLKSRPTIVLQLLKELPLEFLRVLFRGHDDEPTNLCLDQNFHFTKSYSERFPSRITRICFVIATAIDRCVN